MATPDPFTDAARVTAETVARASYGRLVASLARRWGDLTRAEDALSDAFERALRTWPQTGLPDQPEAWLLTTAHRRLIDGARQSGVQAQAEPEIERLLDELSQHTDPDALPDDRLGLMLACAHPGLDAALHTPLMLQAVLGLDAARIGAAFLVSPAAMGQRLSRGKARLRERGARFEKPGKDQLAERIPPVLTAIYAAYGTGWDEIGAVESRVRGLAEEALYLSRVLTELAPDIAEVWGLYALIAHCEARTPARRDAAGRFIPLSDQDPALWRVRAIQNAESALRRSLKLSSPGRYALEASIQSVHAERRLTGETNWLAAAALYDGLVSHTPSLGALTARACAHGEAFGAERALEALAALSDQAGAYQPFWAAQAHWLAQAGRGQEAAGAFERAMALSTDPAVRQYLFERAQAL
ncbi:RNA polymerase sigma factor [Oceanicaulis sp.]|uniref:RNA polymerase sigma factor n=1 Tax=Oceanicaulis sp. TaxID=1924941 RepID=UPI003D2C55DA